jgi:hypothetical protein
MRPQRAMVYDEAQAVRARPAEEFEAQWVAYESFMGLLLKTETINKTRGYTLVSFAATKKYPCGLCVGATAPLTKAIQLHHGQHKNIGEHLETITHYTHQTLLKRGCSCSQILIMMLGFKAIALHGSIADTLMQKFRSVRVVSYKNAPVWKKMLDTLAAQSLKGDQDALPGSAYVQHLFDRVCDAMMHQMNTNPYFFEDVDISLQRQSGLPFPCADVSTWDNLCGKNHDQFVGGDDVAEVMSKYWLLEQGDRGYNNDILGLILQVQLCLRIELLFVQQSTVFVTSAQLERALGKIVLISIKRVSSVNMFYVTTRCPQWLQEAYKHVPGQTVYVECAIRVPGIDTDAIDTSLPSDIFAALFGYSGTDPDDVWTKFCKAIVVDGIPNDPADE